MDGWDGTIAGIRDFDKLPKEAKDYVKRIEELIDSKIILISTVQKELIPFIWKIHLIKAELLRCYKL